MSKEICRKLSFSSLKYIDSAKVCNKSASHLYNELLSMRKHDFMKFNFIKDDVKSQINSYKHIMLCNDESIYFHKKLKYNNMIKYNDTISDEKNYRYMFCGISSSFLIFFEYNFIYENYSIVLYPSLMIGSYLLCRNYTNTQLSSQLSDIYEFKTNLDKRNTEYNRIIDLLDEDYELIYDKEDNSFDEPKKKKLEVLKDKQLKDEELKQKEFDQKMDKIMLKTINVYDKFLDFLNFKLDKMNPKK